MNVISTHIWHKNFLSIQQQKQTNNHKQTMSVYQAPSSESLDSLLSVSEACALSLLPGGAGIILEILSIMEPPPRLWSSFLSSFSLGLSLPLMAFLRRPRAAERSPKRSPGEEDSASSFFAFRLCFLDFASFSPALEAPPANGGDNPHGDLRGLNCIVDNE